MGAFPILSSRPSSVSSRRHKNCRGTGRRRRTRDVVSSPTHAFIARLLLSGWLMMLASWGASDAAPTSQTADLILKNGAVLTMDANRRQVTAVAVQDGKIVFVGSDAGAEAWRGSSTRVVDLRGQMVLPGLHDSHVHLTEGGFALLQCDLTGLTTVQQVLDKVASYAAEHPELTWIVGGGWEATLFPPEGPTHQRLDAGFDEARLLEPGCAISSGEVESLASLDQHVQAHE